MTQPEHYLLPVAMTPRKRLERRALLLHRDPALNSRRSGSSRANVSSTSAAARWPVLSLLSKRVGPTGWSSASSGTHILPSLARRYVAEHALSQVEVREGDAYNTGLPRASFDGAHMRLVLVNVPEPEQIVREMVSLVRPGSWVASFEADLLSSSAIRRTPNGPICSMPTKPIRLHRGSTSVSVDAVTVCFVSQEWRISTLTRSCVSIRQAITGE